jgi:hypothetical protein
VSKKNRGKLKSRPSKGRTPAQKAARRRRARAARAQASTAAPPADKVPQNQVENAKQAEQPARSLGAGVNGHGSAQTSAGQAEKLAAIGEQGHRLRTRGVVYEMLGDGSLLEGLTKALEARAGRFPDTDSDRLDQPVMKVGADRRAMQERAARVRGDVGAQTMAPPSDRYRQFLDVQDVEMDRISTLIGGLEDRLSFLQFSGPAEATNSTADGSGVSLGPSNRLEEELHDRARRLAVVRSRLEQLHASLRI